MECEACKEKDATIERLLDRLQTGIGTLDAPVDGISTMEHLAEQVEADDEERLKKEAADMDAAQEITERFRAVHLTGPYANCVITEATDGEA